MLTSSRVTARATWAVVLLVLLACDYLFDVAGPDVRILQPQDGGQAAGLVQVRFYAKDNRGLKKVELVLDGGVAQSWDAFPGDTFTFDWDLVQTGLDTTHVVKVNAWDKANNGSHAQATFMGFGKLPETPSLLVPVQGDTVAGNPTSYDWTDVAGARVYQIQVDTSQSFATPLIDDSSTASEYSSDSAAYGTSAQLTRGRGTQRTHRLAAELRIGTAGGSAISGMLETLRPAAMIAQSLQDGVHYWRVRARRDSMLCGSWSSTGEFLMVASLPGPPSLVAPANGETLTTQTVGFDWTDVAQSTCYWLQVDTSPGFNTPLADDSAITASSYTLQSSSSNVCYYWRVRAKNVLGWSTSWSEVRAVSVLVASDVGCMSIVAPVDSIDSGAVVAPACSVYNFGNQAVTYQLRMKVGGFYNQTASVADHSPGTTRGVGFPVLSSWQRGNNAVSCSTELADDMNPANDKSAGSVIVNVRDVGCAHIIAPVGTMDSATVLAPACSVHNYGSQTVTYQVRMKVGSFYNRVATVTNHVPGTKRLVTLPSYASWKRGPQAVSCSTELAGDMVRANDKKTGSVTVIVKDVGCTAVIAPTDTVDSGRTVTPACSVWNYGTTLQSYQVRMRIGSSYNQTASVSDHANGLGRYVAFPSWTAGSLGIHAVSCSTELSGDTRSTNNRKRDSVQVAGDKWIEYCNEYNLRCITWSGPQRAVRFNPQEFGLAYPVELKAAKAQFYLHPSYPWSDSTYRIRVYAEDTATILYESGDVEAIPGEPGPFVETWFGPPIVFYSGQFYVAVVPAAGNHPSTCADDTIDGHSFFGQPGASEWYPWTYGEYFIAARVRGGGASPASGVHGGVQSRPSVNGRTVKVDRRDVWLFHAAARPRDLGPDSASSVQRSTSLKVTPSDSQGDSHAP